MQQSRDLLRWVLTALLVAAFSSAEAQTHGDTIDLAQQMPGTTIRLPASGSDQLVLNLRSLLPKRRGNYAITVNREQIAVPTPLPLPDVEKQKTALTAPAAPCARLAAAAAAAYGAKEEAEFAATLSYFEDLVKATSPSTECPAENLNSFGAFVRVLHTMSEASVRLGDLHRGERLTAQITRSADSAVAAKSWTIIYEAPPASYWTPTFGIVALWRQWMPDNRRYLVERDSGGGYVVRDAGRRKADFDRIPVISYSWVDREHTAGGFGWNGLSAGIGLQISDPTIFMGTGIVYRDNIMFNIGLAIHSRSVAKDEYPVGTVVKEKLTRDQLQEAKAAVNPFLSISIRLGKNPFATNEGGTPGSSP